MYDELRPRRKVFEAQFTPLGARAFGISGDRTQNLLWRLQNGELQFRHAPDVVVVCIGTNNIGRDGDGAEDTFLGICAVCAEIQHRLPGSRILLPGILPRGPGLGSEDAASGGMIPGAPGTSADYQIAKDNGDKFAQPGVYTATIDEVNRRLRTFAENPVASGGLVHYVDCQGVFKTASKNGLEPSLMRDALHPTAKGMIAWYSVLAPAIAKLVAAASSAPAQQEHALRAKL